MPQLQCDVCNTNKQAHNHTHCKQTCNQRVFTVARKDHLVNCWTNRHPLPHPCTCSYGLNIKRVYSARLDGRVNFDPDTVVWVRVCYKATQDDINTAHTLEYFALSKCLLYCSSFLFCLVYYNKHSLL